jgi:hypothetical protein
MQVRYVGLHEKNFLEDDFLPFSLRVPTTV